MPFIPAQSPEGGLLPSNPTDGKLSAPTVVSSHHPPTPILPRNHRHYREIVRTGVSRAQGGDPAILHALSALLEVNNEQVVKLNILGESVREREAKVQDLLKELERANRRDQEARTGVERIVVEVRRAIVEHNTAWGNTWDPTLQALKSIGDVTQELAWDMGREELQEPLDGGVVVLEEAMGEDGDQAEEILFRLEPNSLPVYDGEGDGRKACDWILQAQRVMIDRAFQTSTNGSTTGWARCATTFLRGKAAKWAQPLSGEARLALSEREIRLRSSRCDWEPFKMAFIGQFVPREAVFVFRDMLDSVRVSVPIAEYNCVFLQFARYLKTSSFKMDAVLWTDAISGPLDLNSAEYVARVRIDQKLADKYEYQLKLAAEEEGRNRGGEEGVLACLSRELGRERAKYKGPGKNLLPTLEMTLRYMEEHEVRLRGECPRLFMSSKGKKTVS